MGQKSRKHYFHKYVCLAALFLSLTGCAPGKELEICQMVPVCTQITLNDGRTVANKEIGEAKVPVQNDAKSESLPVPPTANPSYTPLQAAADGIVDSYWLDCVDTQLALLPENIVRAFQNDGWTVYVTDMDLNLTYYGGQYGAVMGSSNYMEHRVLIEDREKAVNEAPIHEIGHWLDYHNGNITDTDAFSAVYEYTCAAFIVVYGSTCIRDRTELFAEGFWQYIVNPETLQESVPELYNYISDIVKNT